MKTKTALIATGLIGGLGTAGYFLYRAYVYTPSVNSIRIDIPNDLVYFKIDRSNIGPVYLSSISPKHTLNYKYKWEVVITRASNLITFDVFEINGTRRPATVNASIPK